MTEQHVLVLLGEPTRRDAGAFFLRRGNWQLRSGAGHGVVFKAGDVSGRFPGLHTASGMTHPSQRLASEWDARTRGSRIAPLPASGRIGTYVRIDDVSGRAIIRL